MGSLSLQAVAGIEPGLENLQFVETSEGKNIPRDVRQVLAFIREHLFSPELNVQQLKRGCGIGDNNVSSRFRRAVGIPIKDYIESLRMEAAARLIRESLISIYDIAQVIGYDNPQTFYRAFERRFHCTPATYRLLERRGLRTG